MHQKNYRERNMGCFTEMDKKKLAEKNSKRLSHFKRAFLLKKENLLFIICRPTNLSA